MRPAVFGACHRTRPLDGGQITSRLLRCRDHFRPRSKQSHDWVYSDREKPEHWHRKSRLDNVPQPVLAFVRRDGSDHDTKGKHCMATFVRHLAAGVATLALAFGVVAGTELPAGADVARPATPFSALPQTGSLVKPADSVSIALVSADQKTTKKKKKKKAKKSKGTKALAFAKKQLGDRYRYGGTGPGSWDCSGLTMKAWKHAGKKIPAPPGRSPASARRSRSRS